MKKASADLYSAGHERQYLLVITDGANTRGLEPQDALARVRRYNEDLGVYFVAFNTDAEIFDFLKEAGNADVLEASDAIELEVALKTVYEKRILLEAVEDLTPIPLRSETD